MILHRCIQTFASGLCDYIALQYVSEWMCTIAWRGVGELVLQVLADGAWYSSPAQRYEVRRQPHSKWQIRTRLAFQTLTSKSTAAITRTSSSNHSFGNSPLKLRSYTTSSTSLTRYLMPSLRFLSASFLRLRIWKPACTSLMNWLICRGLR